MEEEYNKKAEAFLKQTKTSFKARFIKNDLYFTDDKEPRDIYRITLKNERHKYSFRFGQSIANAGVEPTAYDVLACIQKYEVGSFEDFCDEFGYDIDSRKAYKTYQAVVKEWQNVNQLWTDEELEELREIN